MEMLSTFFFPYHFSIALICQNGNPVIGKNPRAWSDPPAKCCSQWSKDNLFVSVFVCPSGVCFLAVCVYAHLLLMACSSVSPTSNFLPGRLSCASLFIGCHNTVDLYIFTDPGRDMEELNLRGQTHL